MILGVENPLLDITVNCDAELLQKYGLESNAAILAGPQHLALLDEIKQMPDALYSAGGSVQNAMRTAQWMLGGVKAPSQVTYMGCVGRDDNMEKMKWSVENVSGVKAVYLVDETEPTGTCGVLVNNNGRNRSLVANLGAANHFKKSHLETHKHSILAKASIVYSSGFFITAAADSLEYLCQHVSREGSVFAFNLAAPFICEVEPFRNILMQTIPHVDFLFGNDAEATALAKALGWLEIQSDISAIAQRLADLQKAEGVSAASRKRIVAITQGSEPTIVATQGESNVSQFPIVAVNELEIVDSNGCGDAYAGAFIAGLALGKSIQECCSAGAYAAHVVIKRSGVTLPETCSFQWSN